MKPVAALILNRNLPHLADELGEWIIQHHPQVDLYVLENGSDPDKRSRLANIIFEQSLGPARGINEGVKQLVEKGYKYIWVNFNDARYEQPGFLTNALAVMDQDPVVAMFFPFWRDNIWRHGRRGSQELITFSAILGFVLRSSALRQIANHPHLKLEPLWDSSNYSNHDNILGTLHALYENKLCVVTDPRFSVAELQEPATQQSVQARGYSDEEWKYKKGPADVEAWYTRAYPKLKGTYKVKRATVMRQIEKLIHRYQLGTPPQQSFKRLLQRVLSKT